MGTSLLFNCRPSDREAESDNDVIIRLAERSVYPLLVGVGGGSQSMAEGPPYLFFYSGLSFRLPPQPLFLLLLLAHLL